MKTKIFAAALIFMSSCVAYYPQTVDIPLIRKKGDIRIDAGYFFVPNLNGTGNNNVDGDENKQVSLLVDAGGHATFSAGVTDVLAVQAFASVDVVSRYHLQGALGLFKGFENKTVIELYGGYGYGSGFWNEAFQIRDNYQLAFTQFNIGKSDQGRRHIDYGLGVKGGYLFCNFDNQCNITTLHKKDGWLVEPSVFFRFGGRKVKFCTKVNFLWTNTIRKDYYYPVNLSMGVNISL